MNKFNTLVFAYIKDKVYFTKWGRGLKIIVRHFEKVKRQNKFVF